MPQDGTPDTLMSAPFTVLCTFAPQTIIDGYVYSFDGDIGETQWVVSGESFISLTDHTPEEIESGTEQAEVLVEHPDAPQIAKTWSGPYAVEFEVITCGMTDLRDAVINDVYENGSESKKQRMLFSKSYVDAVPDITAVRMFINADLNNMIAARFRDQEAWVVELETTTKLQGTGYLCSNGRFCCLGVAAQLLSPKIIEPDETLQWGGDDRTLPEFLYKKLDLRSGEGLFKFSDLIPEDRSLLRSPENTIASFSGDLCTLSALNDTLNWDFKTIAAFIRRNPSAIFISHNLGGEGEPS